MSDRPFCNCNLCEFISARERKHVIREAQHVVVLPEDKEYETVGVALCDEHYADWNRTHYGQPLSGLSGGLQ